jgi:hypothetical protein
MPDRQAYVVDWLGEVAEQIKVGRLPRSTRTLLVMVRNRAYDDRGLTVHDGAHVNTRALISNEAAVELARLLIRAAAANGWGSDEDRKRLIAWAKVVRKDS